MHAGKAAWLGQRRVRTQCKGKAAKFCKVTLALIIRIVTRTGLHIGRKKKMPRLAGLRSCRADRRERVAGPAYISVRSI